LSDEQLLSATEDMYDGLWNSSYDYFPVLGCTNLAKDSIYSVNKVITNNGPYTQRNALDGFNAGDKYIVELALYYAKKEENENHYSI
jgi:hypothetical protein